MNTYHVPGLLYASTVFAFNELNNYGILWHLQGNYRELPRWHNSWLRHVKEGFLAQIPEWVKLACWRMRHSRRGAGLYKNTTSKKCELQVVNVCKRWGVTRDSRRQKRWKNMSQIMWKTWFYYVGDIYLLNNFKGD